MRDRPAGKRLGRTRRLFAAAVAAAVVGATLAPPLASAAEAQPAAADPALEARMTAIAAQLRCLVCQNQTIADSNADLAVDLRRQVREMLQKGASERDVVDYMTARYGDFVLYRPPLKATTGLLWFGPAAMLAAGLATLLLVLRRRARLGADRFEADEVVDERGTVEPPPKTLS